MLRCREVTELVGTDGLERAPLATRLGVQLHLLWCRHCRAYARSIRQLAETARQIARDAPAASTSRAEEVLRVVRRASGAAPGSVRRDNP